MADKPRFTCRRAYDVDHDIREGDLTAFHSDEPSMTQQHFTQDANINEIVRRFGLDGQPLPIPDFQGMYTDLRDIPDLRTVLEHARTAKEQFLELPPKLRARFHNNMLEMWEFINDPENKEEALKLGLLVEPKKEPPPEPTPREILEAIKKMAPPTPPAPPTGSGGPPTA